MIRAYEIPYGAFELKRRYQRNMILGTLSAALLAAAIMTSVWIYIAYFQLEIIPVVPPEPLVRVIDTLIIIPPLGPSTDPVDLPGGGSRLPPPPTEFRGGPIVSIPDTIVVQDTGLLPPANNGVYGKFDSTRVYDKDGVNGPIGTDLGGGYIPEPEEFIPYEFEPVLIEEAIPRYPSIAQQAGFSGWVVIQAFVDSHGDVIKAKAVQCNRPKIGFEEEAVKAALKCKYRPAIQNGNPIGIWIAYKVEFKL